MLEESAEGKLKAIRQAIETMAAVRNLGLSFDILSVARVKEEDKNETDRFLEYLHRLSV